MSLSLLLDDSAEILTALPTAPKLYHHGPERFRPLLTREEVDAMIDAGTLPMRNVVLLQDGTAVDPCRYGKGDMPRRGYIRGMLNDKATLSLRGLEEMKPPLAGLAKSISCETGCSTHVNAYYTPAGGHGLRYHYDRYVTLIVQLHGQKAWPVHPPFVENPVQDYGNFTSRGFTEEERRFLEFTPPAETYTLGPGDVLWLPRGYVHSPYTVGDEPSLHITIGLKERTPQWVAAEVAGHVLRQALADPEMRAGLAPADVAEPGDAVKEARAYLIGALAKADLSELSAVVRRAAFRPS
ncbi:ribosomal protein L16 Arg81 hydroxylase [Kitasatospora sp. GP30]|uniref:JmjC domain-containing protein n=1 Tax=Kitasatospora sp. GP30 TaxID=3035084 RepID=UPI000C714E51|nr:cupin domain-containing protein [Kitasatospora sp. GP30]MDH6142646.1 ribosomal protein L16 Arg81 hydroxylase [Kitasatospora sp. GP30]